MLVFVANKLCILLLIKLEIFEFRFYEDVIVTRKKQIIIPIVILIAGLLIFFVFSSMKKPPAEKEEIDIIQEYLPAQMDASELEAFIKNVVEQTGASGMADMGKVMGMASKQLAGKADGKTISGIVRKLLT